jgi:asparagine synthase (glutamine-hydrolysing)
MCGIAGVFGKSSVEIAGRMSAAISHRGPDDEGTFSSDDVTLAHRRLAIIDISSCGHQPMSYGGGRYTIIYNGEVYNFREVRHELESRGHRFQSESDTEVIVAAYAEWGAESVERLRGMFAYAIYDRDAQGADTALFLARDRFGIKPLYFMMRDGAVYFASELKSFLEAGLSSRQLDLEAAWWYLSLGSFPQPATALSDVQMLPAAHVMRVRRDLTIETTQYWDLAESALEWQREASSLDETTAPRRLRELLEEATRLHMIADVRVGAFLSGGIDSTAVVGLMTRESGQRIRTFSVGFEDDETSVVDEREWARLAAVRFNSEHTEVIVRGEDVAGQFDDLVRAIDQPSLDGTNTYLVARAAARDLKVALSGLGGDELFGGYAHFPRNVRADKWNRGMLGANALLKHVPGRYLEDRNFLASSRAQRYGTLRNLAQDSEKASILNTDLGARIRKTPISDLYRPLLARRFSSVQQTTYIDTSRYLGDTLLRDADAMAMASSLEVRPVLLDHRLAEFAFALPDRLKVGTPNKKVLVDAVRDVLPPELLTREKTGFELPLQSWLSGPLRERAIEAFRSNEAREFFGSEFLTTTVNGLERRERQSLRVWAYLMLVEWMRAWGVTP